MSTPNSKCVLSIDLGTSGPKISVVDEKGDILATRSGSFETVYSQGGKAVEQDANDWWTQILKLSKEVIDESGTADRIVAIGNCAQYFSSVPVDKSGNPTHNAFIWEDLRAGKYAKEKLGGFPEVEGYNVFKLLRWLSSVGIPPVVWGVGATPHMLLLKNEMPEVWEKTYAVMEPSDFISMKLTGKFQTNENTGFTYAMIKKAGWSKGTYNTSLMETLGLDESRYPEIVPVGANLGSPTKEVLEHLGISENVTVFSGMQDTTACMLGGGGFDTMDMVIEIGTTLNTGIVLEKRTFDVLNTLYSVSSPVPNRYIMVGEAGAGAKALNYLLEGFFRVADSLSHINAETDSHYAKIADDMAAQSPVGSNGVVFLPWIFGATFPEPDGNMRGGFINLSPENSRNDMIRAVFESYAMSFKWMLELKEKNLKGKIKKVNFTGGGAMWNTAAQICADALKIPVHVMDQPRQANTRGIASVCFNNLGIVTYDEMKQNLKVDKVFEPRQENFAHYDRQFKTFKKLFKKMRPIYRELNG